MTVIEFYNKNQKCVSCTKQQHFNTRLKFLVPLSIVKLRFEGVKKKSIMHVIM